ncbi:alpha-hydroxy acid oxidase [Massilia horti]|uniref:Alpha-hydroxy-acid oxidizing protein n=1 Tax=Massilia horti TaxID=2562153 RepID=A0A4Y9T6P9_9BURK|nr:alpha-hydroxy acid oxidase [Massilia horti]TFW34609.1 alpha-hydroxy-acid oxidizing protein [Massilia horti]
MNPITSVYDLEAMARRRLPHVIFDYVHGGSGRELTLQRNEHDLCALALRQHDMRDVSHRNMKVQMVGDSAEIPLAIGPTGLAGLTWANGEVEAAKAAEQFGVPYCLSTMSICSIEDVAEATDRPFWFQLYLMKEHKVNESLVRRAHDAGCSALVLTLDLHVQGKRWADAKNGLAVPPRLTLHNSMDILSHPRWLLSMAKSRRRTFGNLQGEVKQAKHLKALTQWIEAQFDPSFDTETVKWVRRIWDRKLILKGIMHVDDARLAVDLGADAIIVSNHGGRQLDGAPSSISVLPEIADAVRHRIEVFFDGGIRTGSDIVKAMGYGAHACLSGRAWLYGLAAQGKDGVLCALTLLRDELSDCMALAGLQDVCEMPEDVVTAQPPLAAPGHHPFAQPSAYGGRSRGDGGGATGAYPT